MKGVKGALDKLWYAEQLIEEGKMEEAIPLIKNLEKETNFSSDDQLTFKLIKSEVMKTTGDYEACFKLTDQVIRESLEEGNNLRALKACLVQGRAFHEIGNLLYHLQSLYQMVF